MRSVLTALLLLLAACATAPEQVEPGQAAPDRLIPTTLQVNLHGKINAVLGEDDTSEIELLREDADEPVVLEFRNGAQATGDLAPGAYQITRLGTLACRGVSFDVDPAAGARALGTLDAEILVTDYDLAMMTSKSATAGDVAALTQAAGIAPDGIDTRPIALGEAVPCFANHDGPGTNWRERPLGEQIMFGVLMAGLCAAAVASGGFCAF
jgi:hypothetical protein